MKQLATALLVLWLSCQTSPIHADVILSGAGATFPAPFYQKLIQAYQEHHNTRIDYQSVGSGSGITLLLDKKVDFGATDIFLSDDELQTIDAPVLHIPTCVGAVAVIYNLPGNPVLNLDPITLANLFKGNIQKWSDTRLAAVNGPDTLPNMDVTIVHRSDSSGTTYILTDYLSKTSSRWDEGIGRGKSIPWPVGAGVAGNDGVAEMVARIPGSLGYVSLSYAEKKGLAVAAIKNRAGRFIIPTQDAVSSAAQVNLPEDCRILITDTDSAVGYPISAFTYLLVYQNQFYAYRSRQKAEALTQFLAWIIDRGQRYAKPLYYAPLPDEAAIRATKLINAMNYRGDQ